MADRIKRDYRFATVPEHLIRDKSLSDRAFRLWCILDRYAGADGQAFPLRTTLRDDLGCSLASLDRALLELVDAGWLSKERREAGGSNDYTLHVVAPPKPKPASRKVKAQVTGGGVLTDDDTPPVLTSEDTPLLTDDDTLDSPVTTPVLTGDAHKEASPNENQVSETTSLRSVPDDEQQQSLVDVEPSEPVLRFAKRRQLPDNFRVTQSMREWFTEQHFENVNGLTETELFVHHHRARGNVMKDWVHAWQEWMRKAERYNAPRGRANGRVLGNAHHDQSNDARVAGMFAQQGR